MGRLKLLLGAFILFWAGACLAEAGVPALEARVTDFTATLTAAQKAQLEAKLKSFEERKGSQIVLLLVPTTKPETIEQYAIRVFDKWRLGRKGVDDGVLLLVAKDDRTLRIEVGYGLEGAVPDALAKRVIAEQITPHFKEGNYYGGIAAGVDSLIRLIEGEALPPPVSKGTDNTRFNILIFIAVFALLVIHTIYVSIRRGKYVTYTTGGSSGGGGFFGGGDSGGGGFSGGGGDSGGGGASGSW